MTLHLVDMGSVFWPAWYASGDASDAFASTVDFVEGLPSGPVVVCADPGEGGGSWRRELCGRYKAQRPPKDPAAVEALAAVLKRLRALGYAVAQADRYEADDIVAGYASQAAAADASASVIVYSEDKDLMQCLAYGAGVLVSNRRGVFGPDACREKFGVPPAQMRDFLALVGDAADNVAGCPGIGEGKARALLGAFGGLDGIAKADPHDRLAIPGVSARLNGALRAWLASDACALAVELVSLRLDAPVPPLSDMLARLRPSPGFIGQRIAARQYQPAHKAPTIETEDDTMTDDPIANAKARFAAFKNKSASPAASPAASAAPASEAPEADDPTTPGEGDDPAADWTDPASDAPASDAPPKGRRPRPAKPAKPAKPATAAGPVKAGADAATLAELVRELAAAEKATAAALAAEEKIRAAIAKAVGA